MRIAPTLMILCGAGCDSTIAALGDDLGAPAGDGGAAGSAAITTSSLFGGGRTGALDTLRLADRAVTRGIDFSLDADTAISAGAGGALLVLDRTHGGLRIYRPDAGFTMPLEIAVGDDAIANVTTNPHDALAIPGGSEIYVACYGTDAAHAIAVLDAAAPQRGAVRWIAVPAAGSPSPRTAGLYYCAPYVYALLDDLDAQFATTGPGRIAVIDPARGALAEPQPLIALAGRNPGGGTAYGIAPRDPGGDCAEVLVALAGDANPQSPSFARGSDLELVDLRARRSLSVLLAGDASGIGGSISTVASGGPRRAFLGVDLADGVKVVAIDPGAALVDMGGGALDGGAATARVLDTVFGPAGYIPFAVVSPDGQLIVGVAEGPGGRNGLAIGPADGSRLVEPLVTVDQSPFAIAFF